MEQADAIEMLDRQVYEESGYYDGAETASFGGAAGCGLASLVSVTPLQELLAKEDEGEDEYSSLSAEERMQIRVETFTMVLRTVFRKDHVDLADAILNLAVYSWDLQIPPFDGMTQQELGDLVGQTRAAICERHKRAVQRKKEDAGMKATHNPRQKRESVVAMYRDSARGNLNRRMSVAKKALTRGRSLG